MKSGNGSLADFYLKDMDRVIADYVGTHDLTTLRPLLNGHEACLSLYLPLSSAPPEQARKTDALVWQSLVARLKEEAPAQADLIDTVADWEAIRSSFRPGKAQSAGVFRSNDLFYVAGLHSRLEPRAVVGSQFFVRPMLREATFAGNFYILALSLRDVRLLRCTLESSEEVALVSVVTNFESYLSSAQIDHNRAHHSVAGAASGSSKGVTGNTVSDRETKEEYQANFFKQIDGAVSQLLRDSTLPLVLAGVGPEIASYKRINSYPHLADEFVRGAPNGLKAGEMHSRAIAALDGQYAARIDSVVAEYDHKAGGGASNRLKDIVTAAHDGRLTKLVISETAEYRGEFDDLSNSASGKAAGALDLLNDAAIQTLLHSGTVLVAPNQKMPQGAPAIAVYRY